jgi:hypothetical protein
MDNSVLKKRLSTFRTEGGRLTKVGDDVLLELLRGWEQWTGSAREFRQDLGLSKQQLATLIGKGKRLSKNGIHTHGEFRELKLDSLVNVAPRESPVELVWDQGKVIRFAQVELLIEFLKKAA